VGTIDSRPATIAVMDGRAGAAGLVRSPDDVWSAAIRDPGEGPVEDAITLRA
jgi:hypothetical protein